jgi:hypothetical protein
MTRPADSQPQPEQSFRTLHRKLKSPPRLTGTPALLKRQSNGALYDGGGDNTGFGHHPIVRPCCAYGDKECLPTTFFQLNDKAKISLS